MITIGIIVNIKYEEAKAIVRLPVFEVPGSTNKQTVEASICYTPGNLNGYKKDDVVYVGFENNQIEKPIILGKLYTGEEEASNYSKSNSLEVTGNVKLPSNTNIGDISYNDLKRVVREIDSLNTQLEQVKGSGSSQDIDIIDLRPTE